MNKKAIFMPTLAIATVFLLTYSYFTFIIKDPELYYVNTLGNNQVALSNAYKDAEKDLIYNELAVKYTLYQSIEEFSDNAGVKPSCNKLWIFDDPNCNPHLSENLKSILREKLLIHNLTLSELRIENNSITVILEDKTYGDNLNNFEFNYTVDQEFIYESSIDFNKIIDIKDKLDLCSRNSEDLDTCTTESTVKNGDIIYFTIENNKNLFSLSPSPGFKTLRFEFGVDKGAPREVKL